MSSFTMQEKAVDVGNMDNSEQRWEHAINYYRENCANIRSNRTEEKIRCTAIMDTSYSMDGTRLICVKLGLCSLLANFEKDDEVNIIAFASKITPLSGGFQPVADMISTAPRLLNLMNTNGMTACYDAIIEGIGQMKDRSALCESFAPSEAKFKNVAIVLTDGDDNESKSTPRSVERFLVHPGMNSFMFLFVAVEMSKRSERKFRSWMDMTHCKQVSVNVRTGSSLVGVFKEMLLCRILQTESNSPRFLQKGAGVTTENADGEEVDYEALRAQLLRKLPATDIPHPNAGKKMMWDNDEEESDCDLNDIPQLTRNLSAGVSVVESCSSDDDLDDLDDLDYMPSRGRLGSFSDDDEDDDHLNPDGNHLNTDGNLLMNMLRSRSVSIGSSSSGSDTGDDTDDDDEDNGGVRQPCSSVDDLNLVPSSSTWSSRLPAVMEI
jgi:uncharacterized protein YegL